MLLYDKRTKTHYNKKKQELPNLLFNLNLTDPQEYMIIWTKFYNHWSNHLNRIKNKNDRSRQHYAKPLEFNLPTDYERFEDFYNDMFQSFLWHVAIYGLNNTSLDRINPNLGYLKSNIRWATNDQQAYNKTDTKLFYLVDEVNQIMYLCDSIKLCSIEHNIPERILSACIKTSSYIVPGLRVINLLPEPDYETCRWIEMMLFRPQNCIYELHKF